MLALGGVIHLGGVYLLAYLLHLVFMCDTLLCIRVFTFMHKTIFM